MRGEGTQPFASVVVLIEVALRRRLAAMTPFTKFIFCAAVASLTFGLPWPDPPSQAEGHHPQNYVVLAANEEQSSQPQTQESAGESDKMNTPGMQEEEEAQNPSQPPGAHSSNEN
jgi:hypothetical protein